MQRLHGATLAQIASLLGALLLSTVIVWAASGGEGTEELKLLVSLRWGVVSLVDLYLGFSLFSAWIWFREGSKAVAAAWTLAMMTLGFAAGGLYAALALREAERSPGGWATFWLGARARRVMKDCSAPVVGRPGSADEM